MSVRAEELAEAVAALRRGEVIGLPTETVYGLAGDASNPEAIRRIYAIKGRPANHPVIVHLASADDVPRWAREYPPQAQALAARFWPGPLTLVLPRAAHVLPEVTGGQDTVALRVPAHPVAHAVLEAFGGGLAAPSANRYGRVSPTTAQHVREDLGADVAIVLDGGPSDVGLESTIVQCSDAGVRVLRPGRITAAEIAEVVGTASDTATGAADVPRVPGSVTSHYAPTTPVRLVDPESLSEAIAWARARGARVAVLTAGTAVSDAEVTGIDGSADPEVYGRGLYANLRQLDRAGASVILVVRPPEAPTWRAIHDRLTRAAAR